MSHRVGVHAPRHFRVQVTRSRTIVLVAFAGVTAFVLGLTVAAVTG